MLPKHLMSNSSRKDPYTACSDGNSIDPSLIEPLAGESHGMGSLGAQDKEHGLQILANCKGNDNYPFDWLRLPLILRMAPELRKSLRSQIICFQRPYLCLWRKLFWILVTQRP